MSRGYPLDYESILRELLVAARNHPGMGQWTAAKRARERVFQENRDNREFQMNRPTDEQFYTGLLVASLALNVRLSQASEEEEKA